MGGNGGVCFGEEEHEAGRRPERSLYEKVKVGFGRLHFEPRKLLLRTGLTGWSGQVLMKVGGFVACRAWGGEGESPACIAC